MKIQEEYLTAVNNVKHYESEIVEIEKKYIADNHITNDDGAVPQRLDEIDDLKIAYAAIDDLDKILISNGLQDKINAARESLKQAENKLIDYGLNLIDGKVQITKSDLKNVVFRKKFIDIILKMA